MFPKYEYRNLPIELHTSQGTKACPTRFHKHLELMYIKSVQLQVTIAGQSYTLDPGDIYVAFPNVPHSVSKSESSKTVIFMDSALCPFFHDALTQKIPVCPVVRKGDLPPIVYRIIGRMEQVCDQELPHKQETLAAYANALLGELIPLMELAEHDQNSALIHQLNIYILNNYTRDITLDTLAKELNYSKFYISHLISHVYGCNFRTLINSYRVSLAKNLLTSNNIAVGEVAYACGFKNQSTFNRIFQQYSGKTPSAYRKAKEAPPIQPQVYIR